MAVFSPGRRVFSEKGAAASASSGWLPDRSVLLSGCLLGFLALALFRCSPAPEAPPAGKPAAQAPAPGGGQTAAPSLPPPGASLTEQVQALFNTLREAQLKKDLNLLMSCYSPSFPGLADKRQKTQQAWEDYTFTNMFYFLDEVTGRDSDQARVRVTWELQAQERRSQETVSATQTFWVNLQRQGGAWRIASLEEIPTH
jgi:hypothetical protein